jgi:restriction system protein
LKDYKFWNPNIIKSDKNNGDVELYNNELTPADSIDLYYNQLRRLLKTELLNCVQNADPIFFEKMVIDLLIAMGYGGKVVDAGQNTKKTNDEGIDGIIKEDILGLGNIYLQAKRYQDVNIVGRPAIQAFIGALAGKKARKGIFITTSSFAQNAVEYVKHLEYSVVLIDGEKLTDLMIDYGIGVLVKQTIEIKQLDGDYFDNY